MINEFRQAIAVYTTLFDDIILIEDKIGSNGIFAEYTIFLEEFIKELSKNIGSKKFGKLVANRWIWSKLQD